jgi:hypothetical protein
MYHIHDISDASLLMINILFSYYRVSPAKSSILRYKAHLFLRSREETSFCFRDTSIKHVSKGNTGKLINFLMRACQIAMILEILHLRQLNLNKTLLFILLIHISKYVKDNFLDFLIKIFFRYLSYTGFQLFIECCLNINCIEFLFAVLSVAVSGTAKQNVRTV